MSDPQILKEKLERHFSDKLSECNLAHGEVTIEVSEGELLEVCTDLRDQDDFKFEMLIDLCGIDYLEYGSTEWTTTASTDTGFSRGVSRERCWSPKDVEEGSGRFAVVIHLLSVSKNHRLRVRVRLENNQFPLLPSVTSIWSSANWYEREAFDLYGIVFEGHSDLRRILSDYGFIGYPFRKDYPLTGHVEMRYDPEKKRVIYQPVSIDPRVLVPKVIRNDHRYESGQPVDSAQKGSGESDA